MSALTRSLNVRFNGFNRRNYYLLECSHSIFSSFAISIINPARSIGLFWLGVYPGDSVTLILLNVEFYWDMENTFFSKFTHRGE